MPGVTKEQIQAAREADLFTYLQFHEPGVLKRDGPNFRHKEHDSLVYVTGKRYWYWNSRGRSINALDYLIQIRGYGLVDALSSEYGKPGLLRVLSPGPQCDPERTGRFLRMAGNERLPPLPHRGTALQIAAVFEAQH